MGGAKHVTSGSGLGGSSFVVLIRLTLPVVLTPLTLPFPPQERRLGGVCSHNGYVPDVPGIIWEGICQPAETQSARRVCRTDPGKQEV